jgi:hypothetical protein
MTRVRGDTKFHADHGRDPTAGPQFAAKAVGRRAAMHQLWQAGQLLGRQPPRGPGWRPTPERLGTNVAGPCHPLTDSALADPQRLGTLALRPALLREVPGVESSGFFPGVWCGGSCMAVYHRMAYTLAANVRISSINPYHIGGVSMSEEPSKENNQEEPDIETTQYSNPNKETLRNQIRNEEHHLFGNEDSQKKALETYLQISSPLNSGIITGIDGSVIHSYIHWDEQAQQKSRRELQGKIRNLENETSALKQNINELTEVLSNQAIEATQKESKFAELQRSLDELQDKQHLSHLI